MLSRREPKSNLCLSLITSVILLFSLGIIAGCARERPLAVTSLDDLERLSGSGAIGRVAVMRSASLRDTALGIGARGGLAWRAAEINRTLLKHEKMLNRVYNFNLMLLDKNVLPPVLIEGRNALTLGGTKVTTGVERKCGDDFAPCGGADTIRLADRMFKILCQAKFVTAAPTWRDYLWFNHKGPETPDRSLLPRTREERIVWKRFLADGWAAGMQQADHIFDENIHRLTRDFEGMIRYRTLLAQNMVSPPFVAQMDMGITGGGNDLAVNDRILRITAFPALQNDNGREWKTEIIPYE